MYLQQALQEYKMLLMETAVSEIMGQRQDVTLDPRLGVAPCIYDPLGRKALSELYQELISIAQNAGIPLLVTAPTWRANQERVAESGISQDLNRHGLEFIMNIRNQAEDHAHLIPVGGLLACKNDAYQPQQGLNPEQAYAFHSWQAKRLAEAGAEFLMAATLPAVPEALGQAQAMAQTGLDFIVSFVLNRQGRILDGSTLTEAMDTIDSSCNIKPLGYMVNCSYPSFLHVGSEPKEVLSRLIGYQANASSLDHSELDNAQGMLADDIQHWAAGMMELNRAYGIRILGGCCGSTPDHLQALVNLAFVSNNAAASIQQVENGF